MRDELRKRQNEGLFITRGHAVNLLDSEDEDKIGEVSLKKGCVQNDVFKEMVSRRAFKEMSGFLKDVERRILKELIEPSDEFCWFERKKAAVSRMLRKQKMWRGSHKPHPDVDESMVEFLMITPECYLESINHIRQVFTENIIV